MDYWGLVNSTGFSFMALASKSTVVSESHAMLLFLGLLLVASLLAGPIDSKKLIPSSQTTTGLQPSHSTSAAAATFSGSDSGQQFKEAAHEVPSGPNPESNK